MRNYLVAAFASASFLIASPAIARGFDSTVETQLTTPVKIEVVLSEDMAYRANNLPKKLSDRGGARGFNQGFSGNGFYGEKDLTKLTSFFQDKMTDAFTRKGLTVSDDAPVVLRVTVEDAKPNRPTFKQLSKQPSLSYESIANGGAELSAELISAGGTSLGTMNYKFYETDLRDSRYGSTWSDARQSMRRFANKAAKTLAN